jgi:hypothetical protein
MSKCVCQNGADSPSTHRAGKHFDPRCPHSTLRLTTSGKRYPTPRAVGLKLWRRQTRTQETA